MGPIYQRLPEYIASNAYQDPASASNGPFQYGHDTIFPFFEWLKVHPDTRRDLANNMTRYQQGQPSWLDPGFFPAAEVLGEGLNAGDNTILLVDVGGSTGHDIADFHRRNPHLPGRLILQDLSGVIEQLTNLDKRIRNNWP
jgi:hypothetical protein